MDYAQIFEINVLPNDETSVSYSLGFSDIADSLLNKNMNLGKSQFIDGDGSEYWSNEVVVFLKTNMVLECNYNFVCDPGENYANCFQDCISGSRDGYCDKLDDARCDIDCLAEEDPNCIVALEEEKFPLLTAVIIGFAIFAVIVLLILVYMRRRSRML